MKMYKAYCGLALAGGAAFTVGDPRIGKPAERFSNATPRKTVFLDDLRLNEGIDTARLMVEAPEQGGWDVDIRPWEEK